MIVLEKLGTSLFFAFCVISIAPIFPVESMLDPESIGKCSLWLIIVYMIISTTCARFKYFHAWKLGETLTNACGFGFNGFDEQKNPKWDLISSVDIVSFEVRFVKHCLIV
jgi:lysophospholipid acyltransferase 1/2